MNNQFDPEGKMIFIKYLQSRGFKDIKVTDTYCRYDLTATKDNQPYYFELKMRSVPSDQYKDAIIQEDKYEALKDLPNCYIVNLYTDGLLAVVPVTADHVLETHFCQRTNNWDRTKTKKVLVSYPLHLEYLRSYKDIITNILIDERGNY